MAFQSQLTTYIVNELKKLVEDKETPAKVKFAALQQLVLLRPTSRLGRQSVKKGQERKLLGALRARTENERAQAAPATVDRSLLGLPNE